MSKDFEAYGSIIVTMPTAACIQVALMQEQLDAMPSCSYRNDETSLWQKQAEYAAAPMEGDLVTNLMRSAGIYVESAYTEGDGDEELHIYETTYSDGVWAKDKTEDLLRLFATCGAGIEGELDLGNGEGIAFDTPIGNGHISIDELISVPSRKVARLQREVEGIREVRTAIENGATDEELGQLARTLFS